MGDNTSPILLTDVPQQIATFNRPFELSELVGNLDGVMYLAYGAAENVTCVSDVEEGETKYFLAYDNGEAHIGELSVEGTTLLCSEKGNENYLFDLDFKHQNLKFFEQANGTYAISLPWLGLDADSKVLVSVSGESSGKTVTIHYVDNDYRAWGQAGGAIREISWFNELLTSANIANIVSLVDEIIKLEYSPEAAGGITVTSANTQPSTVSDDWNLFTDGTAYIPLRIISRFPNGSPVNQYYNQLALLNREAKALELINHVECIVGNGNTISIIKDWDVDGNRRIRASDDTNIVIECSLENQQWIIRSTNISQDRLYYDIDYDHQFRRSIPPGVTKMNVQLPQLLGNPATGQGVAIVTDSESPDQLYVIANNDNKRPYICQGDTVQNQQGEWANNLSFDNVSSLLQAIVAMEFTGYDEIPINIQDSEYKESAASGYVVTPLIPQTLS